MHQVEEASLQMVPGYARQVTGSFKGETEFNQQSIEFSSVDMFV